MPLENIITIPHFFPQVWGLGSGDRGPGRGHGELFCGGQTVGSGMQPLSIWARAEWVSHPQPCCTTIQIHSQAHTDGAAVVCRVKGSIPPSNEPREALGTTWSQPASSSVEETFNSWDIFGRTLPWKENVQNQSVLQYWILTASLHTGQCGYYNCWQQLCYLTLQAAPQPLKQGEISRHEQDHFLI